MPHQAEVPSPRESLFDLPGAITCIRQRNDRAGAGTVKIGPRSSLFMS